MTRPLCLCIAASLALLCAATSPLAAQQDQPAQGDRIACLDATVPTELLDEVTAAMSAVGAAHPLTDRRRAVLKDTFVHFRRPGGSSDPGAWFVFRYAGVEALPFLAECLMDADRRTRWAAAFLLCAFEDNLSGRHELDPEDVAQALLPLVLRTTYDVDDGVRSTAQVHLHSIWARGGPEADERILDGLVRLLADPVDHVREGAAAALHHAERDDLVPPELLERARESARRGVE